MTCFLYGNYSSAGVSSGALHLDHQTMGNDDLRCHQVWIFGMAKGLGNCFIAQLEGSGLNEGELG